MQLKESKKAKALISQLNENEKTMYQYIVELIKQDNEHIKNCEIEKQFNEDKTRFNNAINRQVQLSFRAKYILQIFGLHLYDDMEKGIIEITTKNE